MVASWLVSFALCMLCEESHGFLLGLSSLRLINLIYLDFCIQPYLYLDQTEECPNGGISVQGQPLLVKHRFCIFWFIAWFSCSRGHLPQVPWRITWHCILLSQSPPSPNASYIYRRSGVTAPSPFNSASATRYCLCLSDRQVCLKCLCVESQVKSINTQQYVHNYLVAFQQDWKWWHRNIVWLLGPLPLAE